MWQETILILSDNTFAGTLFAGVGLAVIGLWAYRSQKRIDRQYEDLRELQKKAGSLYSEIETAKEFFEGQINIYSGEEKILQNINKNINQINNNYFHNKAVRQSNKHVQQIDTTKRELVSKLKVSEKDFESQIEIINENTPILMLYLSGVTTFPDSAEQDIKIYREEFISKTKIINLSLQQIIDESI